MRNQELILYGSSLLFNFALSMSGLLVPLLCISMGLSAFQIGLVVSSQAFIQVPLRLMSGIITARYGEKRMLVFSFGTMAVATAAFACSTGAVWWGLMFIQLIMGLSRMSYWSPSQSYASKIGGDRKAAVLGRLTSYVNFGMVSGLLLGGVSAFYLGYKWSFLICSLFALISLLLVAFLPAIAGGAGRKTFRDIFRPLPGLLRLRPLYLSGLAAHSSAFVIALTFSFFPILFQSIGYEERYIGFFNALRPLAVVFLGFLFGMLIARWGTKRLFFAGMLGMGVCLAAAPALTSVWSIVPNMLVLGCCSGIIYIIYQTIVAEHSDEQNRAVSYSISGTFYSLAHVTAPTLFGILTDWLGIGEAFRIGGVLFIAIALLTQPLFAILIPKSRPSLARAEEA